MVKQFAARLSKIIVLDVRTVVTAGASSDRCPAPAKQYLGMAVSFRDNSHNNMSTKWTLGPKEQIFLTSLFILSLAANVMLVTRAEVVSRRLSALQSIHSLHKLMLGEQVPAIKGQTLANQPMTINFSASPKGTILYIFSPSCHWCMRNMANMHSLEEQTRGRYQFVGISLDSDKLAGYVVNHKLLFPVLHSVLESISTAYGFGATPETILVSSEGLVAGVWKGAYGASDMRELAGQLGVDLPGLLPDSPVQP